ncbi:MAG TPA: type III pantothenate kinase [Bacilli bacterium]|uniref:Type III pantothenate kinase n=1 Tax=Amphibacillus indicireducens TaxID=1076330 RepID=A0ABP7VWG0_9BACI|nr:type III pantothenate kinase [Bacilli bacterium]
MLLVLDVGNTNTVLGLFENDQLAFKWRIRTDREKTEDEYAVLVSSLFEHRGVKLNVVSDIIISSVVPPIMYALEKMAKYYFNVKPIVVGDYPIDRYLKMTYPNPKELGADRIVNAVGAIKEYGQPLIIIDFGTATTYCYINEDSAYVGGAIIPGIKISVDALYDRAAKLPRVEIEKTDKVIGTSTIEAIQSGVYYGYVGQVDSVIRQIKAESKQNPKVIATGGLAELIGQQSQEIDVIDMSLTLKGLAEIYRNVK